MKKTKFLTIAAISCAAFLANSVSGAILTSLGDPALAGGTVIDFNAEPVSDFASTTIAGVTFNSAGAGQLRIAPYGEGGVYGETGNHLSTRNSGTSFDVIFSNVVSAFGMIWGAGNPSWTISVFDSSNVLIDSGIVPSGPPLVIETGFESAGIARAEFRSNGGYDWVKIDNFTFVEEGQRVPDTGSTAALLLAGIVGLAALKRRK